MKIAIIQFPGSNCETESLRAVRATGMDAEEFLWNRDTRDLGAFDGYFIVGGFSYEDRSRAGIIASLDPIMKYLRAENEKGKPILGVCNGAQILVEAGFVPGLNEYKPGMALAANKRIQNGRIIGAGFYNSWVNIKLSCPPDASAFTCTLNSDFQMKIPVAHAEGRFCIPQELLTQIKARSCETFKYCASNGLVNDEFPVNPNGSVENLAGVSNAAGNCLALMPHPERTPVGSSIFESMRQYILHRNKVRIRPYFIFEPPRLSPLQYQKPLNNIEIIVESIITDNEAFSVQSTLAKLGIYTGIKKFVHWEISVSGKQENVKKDILKTGELFNPNKEKEAPWEKTKQTSGTFCAFLVRYHDDMFGERMEQTLKQQYDITDIDDVYYGILWIFTANKDSQPDLCGKILETNIIYNQYSQQCFFYP